MRQHLAWPRFQLHHDGPRSRLVPSTAAPPVAAKQAPADSERWQTFKDKLAVAAVVLLVLATITVFVLYLVQQAPRFSSGELTGFATPAPTVLPQAASGPAGQTATNSFAGIGLGRVPLILISTVVEMAIFVALGLYLRHDTKRNP